MKTILLTGATGFLGSYLLRSFLPEYRVIILKRSGSNVSRIAPLLKNVKQYDIDKEDLEKVYVENSIDAVVHTATAYGRDTAIASVLASNILFPVQLLELAIKHKVSSFVNTDTFYYRDYDNYSLTKKQFLDWLLRMNGVINAINVRLEHMYGPDDNRNKVLPQIIQKLLSGEDIDLTYGEQRRDFVYVEDVSKAFLVITKEALRGCLVAKHYEIGSGFSVSLKDVISELKEMIGSQSKLNFGAVPYRSNEIMESHADTSEIIKLGWGVEVNLSNGLKRTIDFERDLLCRGQKS